MANKLKSSKNKAAEPGDLKQEKEETVQVKQLLKDERTHKIAGSIFLLLAFLFFIAFTSYLFTWGEDQRNAPERNGSCSVTAGMSKRREKLEGQLSKS